LEVRVETTSLLRLSGLLEPEQIPGGGFFEEPFYTSTFIKDSRSNFKD
jgi:hypothetical protein